MIILSNPIDSLKIKINNYHYPRSALSKSLSKFFLFFEHFHGSLWEHQIIKNLITKI